MSSVQNGDQDAFGILVHRHIDSLYNYALRLCHIPANAEDLVQDTWLACWQHAGRFRPQKAKVTTWLHSILYNKFVDTTRKRRPMAVDPLGDVLDDALSETGSEGEPYVSGENEQKLLALISTLPLNQRSALVLTHLQGFSNQEVAKIMGLGLRAVESLLARARRTLKSNYEQDPANS